MLCKWPHINAFTHSGKGEGGLSLNEGQTAGEGKNRDYQEITMVRGKLE